MTSSRPRILLRIAVTASLAAVSLAGAGAAVALQPSHGVADQATIVCANRVLAVVPGLGVASLQHVCVGPMVPASD